MKSKKPVMQSLGESLSSEHPEFCGRYLILVDWTWRSCGCCGN
jgi:hypothetical protein